MEWILVKSLHVASRSCFESCRLQVEFQIYVSGSTLHWRIKKNIFVSVWEPLGCEVLKHLAAAENLAVMFKSWPEHTQFRFADTRNQAQWTILRIFNLLTDIFWRLKSCGLNAQERKPPAPQLVLAWALAVGPDNFNKLWAWLLALSETVKKADTPMTAFRFRSCW